jgi:phage protein D
MVQADRNEPLVPAFSVALSEHSEQPDDNVIPRDVLPWITSVSVVDHCDKPATFTLELISREEEDGTTSWMDDARFVIGANVAVSLGYGSTLERVIVGEITGLAPAFTAGGSPSLTVHGADLRHRLDTVRRIRPPFREQTLSQIAEQICKDHMSLDATDSKVIIPYLLQANKTDLEFLKECAARLEYELVMQDQELSFRPIETRKASIATLTLDDDLLEFHPVLSLLPLTGVDVPGWDPENKQALKASVGDEGRAGMGGTESAADQTKQVLGETREAMPVACASTQAELDQLARATFNTAALDYMTGSGRCRGRTDLRAGTIIRIEGVGTRFSGDYYVESTTHSYKQGGDYVTSFHVRRNAS